MKRLRKLREVQEKGKCAICMDLIKRSQGALACLHDQFCFDCIWGWGQISNKCPLCMKKFFSILNKDEHEEFEVEDKTNEESSEEEEIDIICELCSLGDHEDSLLLCDTCDKGYHTYCIGITRIPYLDKWFCDRCILDQSEDVQEAQVLEISLAGQINLPVKRSRAIQRNVVRRSRRLRRLSQ